MSEKKNIKVSILGKNYFVATDEPDVRVLDAARLVDNLLGNVTVHKERTPDFSHAILVLLQLAAELGKKTEHLDQAEARVTELNDLLAQFDRLP